MKKFLFVVVLILAAFLQSCGGYELTSKYTEEPVVIDGNINDWNGRLNYIEEEQAAVGIANDNNFLYVCYTTANRNNILKILRMGFTVWFFPENGKTIGFQYPLKSSTNSNFLKRSRQAKADQMKLLLQRTLKNNNEYRIVNEKSFPLITYGVKENNDIQVAMKYRNSKFVYELKLPLNGTKGNYDAIQSKPGEHLKLVFESGEFTKGDFAGSSQRNGLTGGRAGSHRGGGRIGSTPMKGNAAAMSSQIDFSVEIDLAIK